MQVKVGYSDIPDSMIAGKQAANNALSSSERSDLCDFVLLFATARHNQEILRVAVAEVTGNHTHIFGGGAVGIITNEKFGYAGDQVGVACIWLDDSKCTILTEEGLKESELDVGLRLGKSLKAHGIKPDSSVMMFYDAVDHSNGDVRLLMATWLLEGLNNGLGFFPDLTGAGLQGDHMCTPTKQFLGDKIGEHSAFALNFSDDICMDTVIMHGCHPASPYYSVTKADGPVILEINNKPALEFMDELLDSKITPDEYPFFLIFGINHGKRWGEYNENNYASRLCLGIDKERNGIVMFEPDMIEGTKFQLMFRSLEMDYMKPKLDDLFEKLEGRELLFSMYIDCAGRCAGYGGVDLEDAFVIQEAVKDKVPLLGLYTGVEIAPIGGRPRGLDWTGVFCVFSKRNMKDTKENAIENNDIWSSNLILDEDDNEIPMEAVINLCEQNAAKILELDTQSISIRHELEQKRRGFSLLAELSVSLRKENGNESLFLPVVQKINAALNMQRTIVLVPDAEGKFVPSTLQGYSVEEKAGLIGKQISIDLELLDKENPILVTGEDGEDQFADLRKDLNLTYFISSTVVIQNEIAAILITGRMIEATPFLSRLDHNDAETVQAICALLATVLLQQQLDVARKQAQTDALTGLYNRGALETKTRDLLHTELPLGKKFAFIMIDFDHFKEVNDGHGHMVGDVALKALSNALKKRFRSTDIVSRMGGDEFAVVCSLSGGVENIINRVANLLEQWNNTEIGAEDGTSFYATLSIGISVAPRDGVTYEDLVRKADIALYKSKQRGRNQYTIFDEATMDKI